MLQMRMIRMFPPTPGASVTVHGRSYCSLYAVDVPDFDARLMHGWVAFGSGDAHHSGPTSERPQPGHGSFFDTSIGEMVTWVPDPASPGGRGGRWVDRDGQTA